MTVKSCEKEEEQSWDLGILDSQYTYKLPLRAKSALQLFSLYRFMQQPKMLCFGNFLIFLIFFILEKWFSSPTSFVYSMTWCFRSSLIYRQKGLGPIAEWQKASRMKWIFAVLRILKAITWPSSNENLRSNIDFPLLG